MAYIPESQSVVAFQSDPTKLVGTVSVVGILPVTLSGNPSISGTVQVGNFPTSQNVSGSVVAFGTVGASIIGTVPVTQATAEWTVKSSIAGGIFPISGSVAVGNFPTNQNISGSVVAFGFPANQSVSGTVGASVIGLTPIQIPGSVAVAIVSGSIAATFTPPANQSVSGEVSISNFPTTQNVSGSVVATQGTTPWIVTGNNNSVIGVQQGSVAVAIVSGSIAATFTPPANQSVSGTVGASIIGLPPVNVTNTNLNVAGSIAGTYVNSNTPSTVTGIAMMFKQNVVTSVMTEVSTTYPLPISVMGLTPVSVTFPTNQNVSGSVVAFVSGLQGASVSGQVGASLIGLSPVRLSDGTATATIRDLAANDALNVAIVDGSGDQITTFGGGTQYAEDAVVPSVTGTAMMFRANQSSSIMDVVSPGAPLPVSVIGLTPVNVTNTNINVSGSVVASGFPTTQNVSGSVVAFGTVGATQSGTWIVSVVGSTPSSMLVGASIIGLTPVTVSNTNVNVSGSVVAFGFPTNQNVSGSVVAFVSGTPNVNTAGSVVAFQGTSPWVIQSIVGTYAEDAAHTSADKGLFVLGVRNDALASFVSADLEYNAFAHDSAGRVITKPFAAEDGTIISYNGSVVSGSVTLIQASVIGKRSYITDWAVTNTGSVAQLVTFQGGDTSIVAYTIAPAGGGSNKEWLVPPKTTASQDLAFKTTGTSSIVYVTVKGYVAP